MMCLASLVRRVFATVRCIWLGLARTDQDISLSVLASEFNVLIRALFHEVRPRAAKLPFGSQRSGLRNANKTLS